LEGQEEMAQMASGQDLQGSIQQHIEQSRGHAKEPGAGLRPSGLGAPARDQRGGPGVGERSPGGDIQEAQNDAIHDCAIVAAVTGRTLRGGLLSSPDRRRAADGADRGRGPAQR
jgi:hypothetical protein